MPNCHSLLISRPTMTALSHHQRVLVVPRDITEIEVANDQAKEPRISLDYLPNKILDHILRLFIPEKYRIAPPQWNENPKLPLLLVNHRIAEYATNQSSIGGLHISSRSAHDGYKTIAALLDGCCLSKRACIQRVATSDYEMYKWAVAPVVRANVQSRVEAEVKDLAALLSCYYEEVVMEETTVIWGQGPDYGPPYGPAHCYNAWTCFQVDRPRDPRPRLERVLRVVPFWCRTT